MTSLAALIPAGLIAKFAPKVEELPEIEPWQEPEMPKGWLELHELADSDINREALAIFHNNIKIEKPIIRKPNKVWLR